MNPNFLILIPFTARAAAVVLRVHDLHPDLHDGVRVLDELLAGPQVRPRPRGPHHHHAARHVHHHLLHQQLPAARGLHQGRMIVRSEFILKSCSNFYWHRDLG